MLLKSVLRTTTVVALLFSAMASAAPTVTSSTVGTADPGVVYRGDQLLPFLQAMQTGRVDIAGIGDSNQLSAGTYGHDHGQALAWSNFVGLYGTGVVPTNAQGGNGAIGINYGAGSFSQPPPSVAPEFAGRVFSNGGFLLGSYSLASGSSLSSNGSQVMLGLGNNVPWGIGAEQKWHFTYGTFAGAAGDQQFQPSARYAGSGAIVAQSSTNLSTIGAAGGLVDGSLTIPGDATRTQEIWLEPTTLFSKDLKGPFFANWQRVEATNKLNGVAYSTLLYQGGQGTRAAAEALRDAPHGALAEWIRQATRLQNVPQSQQRLMVELHQGGNDTSDPATAVGSTAASNTPEGYKANLLAVITRLKAAWAANGYDPAKLNFVVGMVHAQDVRTDWLKSIEGKAVEVADSMPNVTVVRTTTLLSQRTMLARDWYANTANDPSDVFHLNPNGYIGFNRFVVNQMSSLLGADDPSRSNVSSLEFAISEDVDALTPEMLKILNVDSGQMIDVGDLNVFYDADSDIAKWTFPGLPGDVLPAGRYAFELDFDGVGGADPYAGSFTAVPEPTGLALAAAGVFGLLGRRRRTA